MRDLVDAIRPLLNSVMSDIEYKNRIGTIFLQALQIQHSPMSQCLATHFLKC